jgi:murein DD-endopeptidase MepM/ murein hydrolase activator NlpD
MKFLRSLFSKNTYSFLNLSKEVLIALMLIFLPVLYPSTALAGIFSFISGDKVAADTQVAPNVPNSQNMTVLKAVINRDPSPTGSNDRPILALDNALVAEIGPAGTASDVDETSSSEISLYVVRSGDTLSGIAKMYGVSVNTIVWANDISRTTALREGQTLVILPITGIRHIVKKGDTIKSIVLKYKADLNEVLEFNDLTLTSDLQVGDTIIIPDAEPTTPPKAPGTSSGVPSYPGYYMRPIIGGHKSQGIHGHNAVDLAAPVGTPIYAAAGGTVIVSISNNGWNGGYGNYVVISHSNGTQTLYAHTSTNLVNVGDKVARGDLIAKVGLTGKTTGAHVHFEIRGAVNPF